MELAVETEWETITETHLFEKCEDINNDRKGVSWEGYCWQWFVGISGDTEGTDT